MNFKYFISGCLCTIVLLLLIFMININVKHKEMIEVVPIKNYNEQIESFNKKISNIKNKECKSSIEELLKNIDSTNYTKDVSVEEYYNNYFKDRSFIDYYIDTKEACNIKDDAFDSVYITALSSMNYPNYIKDKYLTRYEFNIIDTYSRSRIEGQINNTGTYTTKTLELRSVKELLEVIK